MCGIHVDIRNKYDSKLIYIWIRRKDRVRVPGKTSKRNTENITSTISSQQISGKKLCE